MKLTPEQQILNLNVSDTEKTAEHITGLENVNLDMLVWFNALAQFQYSPNCFKNNAHFKSDQN